MKTSFFTAGLALIVCTGLCTADAADEKITYVDLQPRANHKLTDTYPSKHYENNDLGELPTGKQTFDGIPFFVGEKMIVLGSKRLPLMPEKVKGIAVGARANQMHILHASCYNTVEDGTLVGKYVVNYDDKSQETIELVYGKDLRDWWAMQNEPEVTRGKVIWTGNNKTAKERGFTLRLFLLTWKNPKPARSIASIDFIGAQTDCAPFCVAITLDRK